MYVIDDYDTLGYNMKGIEPIICKRIRRIFKNSGYESYLIMNIIHQHSVIVVIKN